MALPVYAQTGGQPTPQSQQISMLGVVRSAENSGYWESIQQRLQATGVSYRAIDWEQVEQPSDLAGVTILFLPNVGMVTATQLSVLETWVAQGGRLVVSGPLGNAAEHEVRRGLQELLGAYWAFELPEPMLIQPVQTITRTWTMSGEAGTHVAGGVMIPVRSGQTAAVWQTDQHLGTASTASISYSYSSAVIVTAQTTFLGWYWGNATAVLAEFDVNWLRAALDRYGDLPAMNAGALPTVADRPTSQPTPAPINRLQPLPAPRLTGTPLTLSGSSQDPAERSAPAGVPVELTSQPISASEAIAMQQELQNLIGRFESALLSANSRDSSVSSTPSTGTVANREMQMIASTSRTQPDHAALLASDAAVTQARQALEDFPQRVARQEYAIARRQWLSARQELWDHFPTDRPLAQSEIRAIWLDRGTIVNARSRQGLARIFDRLAAVGINTVFFETVNAGYPIYPSAIAPEQNPLIRGWDPLEDAVDLAHERGLELHAWVWTFAAGNTRHNAIVNQSATYPGPLIAAHADWANYDNQGRMIPQGQTKPFLDPANPEVRRYLLSLFEEIVTRYDVDGLQLDYIRYPFQDPSAGRSYGYGAAARSQFRQMTGVDPLTLSPGDRQLWAQWTNFRTEQIDSFVAETDRLLEQINPDLILSAAVFPMPEHQRRQEIQQAWETWARRGDVDLIVPMCYALDTSQFQRMAAPWLADIDLGSTLVLPAIRLLDLSEYAAIDQLQAIRDLPSGGYALFATADLGNPFEGILQRTQGRSSRQATADPIPYRQPFDAAAARFAALEREWSFLLTTGQLAVTQPMLEEWSDQSAALREALEALAERPSSQRLAHATRLLTHFRYRFDRWTTTYAVEDEYRVQTWSNRLAALDTLLNYGEQRALQSDRRRTSLPPLSR